MKKPISHARLRRFIKDITVYTPFTQMILLLIVLWLIFSAGMYLAERGMQESFIKSYGDALYWGVAAFCTSGIAEAPLTGVARVIGGFWIVIGSALFFGTIIATITSYFMRPMQRPHKRIIDTIEYNLEQLNDLTPEELDLLKDTVNTLIAHVEQLKEISSKRIAQEAADNADARAKH